MRLLLSLLPFVSLAPLFFSSPARAAHAVPCAVIELFSSEGCSSCPPADALLSDLIATARKNATPVFALDFHVDYWNHLGWKDPFSDAAFTARQTAYAKTLQLENLYTPQMIVNGTTQFVGSDRPAAQRAIAAALAKPAPASLTVTLAAKDKTTLLATVATANADPAATLNLALVESNLQSNVTAGENAGRSLTHDECPQDGGPKARHSCVASFNRYPD